MGMLDEIMTRLNLSPEKLEKLKQMGGDAVTQALSTYPGMNSVKDIAANAGPLFDAASQTPTGQAMARGATGAPITPEIPNPGNPLSGVVQGAIAPTLTDALTPDPSQERHGATRSWEPNEVPPTLETPPSAPAASSGANSTPALEPAPAPLDPFTAMMAKDPTEDERRRDANNAAIEHKRRMSIIPEMAGGVADAFASGAQGYGLNIAADSQSKIAAQGKASREEDKTNFEKSLKDDANSDISKQYQALVAEMMKKSPKDPLILGMTANQIIEKVPAIEKIMTTRSAEDLKRLDIRARAAEKAAETAGKPAEQTTAQKAVDKAFAKTYEDFVVQGGYGKGINQLQSLVGIAEKLESGDDNLTGPGKGRMPEWTRPTSVAVRQQAEQAIQEGLRATLGAQFTENEQKMFLARSYDEKLPEKQNAEKIRRAAQTLQLMMRAKKQAADYYEDNGTLTGYKGKLYTLKDGAMVEANPAEFDAILSAPLDKAAGSSSMKSAKPKSDPMGLF